MTIEQCTNCHRSNQHFLKSLTHQFSIETFFLPGTTWVYDWSSPYMVQGNIALFLRYATRARSRDLAPVSVRSCEKIGRVFYSPFQEGSPSETLECASCTLGVTFLGSRPLLSLCLRRLEFTTEGCALKFLRKTPLCGRNGNFDFFTPSEALPGSATFCLTEFLNIL